MIRLHPLALLLLFGCDRGPDDPAPPTSALGAINFGGGEDALTWSFWNRWMSVVRFDPRPGATCSPLWEYLARYDAGSQDPHVQWALYAPEPIREGDILPASSFDPEHYPSQNPFQIWLDPVSNREPYRNTFLFDATPHIKVWNDYERVVHYVGGTWYHFEGLASDPTITEEPVDGVVELRLTSGSLPFEEYRHPWVSSEPFETITFQDGTHPCSWRGAEPAEP